MDPVVAGLVGFVPLAMLFVGLGFTKLPAHGVAVVSSTSAMAMAFVGWGLGSVSLGWAVFEGGLTALLPILWVVLAAVFVFLVGSETGGMDDIRHFLKGISPDPAIQAVLVAFCFGGFLEAVAGFGTAVAIPAAMLIALSFHPIKAMLICLVANSVPVAFGALGVPLLALGNVTGLDVGVLTRYVAVQLALFAVLVPVALVWMANPERSGRIHRMGTAVGIGSVFSVLQLVIAWTAGPELVAVGASLGSLLAYVAFQKLTGGMHESTDVKRLRLLKALAPFGCLLVLVLVTRLAPMPAWLKSTPFVWCFERDGHVFKVDLATTPGTLLMLSGCFGAWLGGLRWKATFVLFGRAMWKLRRTAVVVFSILVMAKVMAASGMIRSVAALLASCTGFMFPFISPFLGAMGTFVTGSDTSSNILLGALQKQTAMNTGYDPAWLAAANTAGATAGKMISPQSISVGASTVGLESRQGDVLKVTLLYCLGYLIVLGLGILLSSLIFFRVVSVLPF